MSSTVIERVILVDEHDNAIGSEEKLRAHTLGLLHRAFSIFIFRINNSKLELLLQQRNPDKYHCGGLWTNTCCSHPRVGEELSEAIHRRLQEEMGFTTNLQLVGAFKYRAELANGLIEHEYDHVFVGMYNADEIKFNPDEVYACRWIALDDLSKRLEQHTEEFTPWFAEALSLVVQQLRSVVTC